jgi:ADP-ribosylglycohydrolase
VSPAAASAAPPLPNSYWVYPGRLLAGEYPGGATPEHTRLRLAPLLEAGLDCFIDLTQPQELAAYQAELPAGVDYFRKPIPDHGLPGERALMAEILDCLRDALRAGRRVYLHCRAGIGRTGMVAGCLLAEQGLGGEEALAQLNRLWLQSARATQWPEVPETPEQADYVRLWSRASAPEDDPLLHPTTLAAARGLRERFQGALLGLAVGDAVAAATQYGRPGRFAPVGDMLGGGPFDLPRGGWSDDTAMALCLAESLLESEGFDARDQVARYRRWQQQGYLSATGQCVGITAGTARALAIAQWRRQPFSGTHDPDAQEPEPLSRVAAAVMYFFGRGATIAVEQAAEATRTTCQVPAVLAACRTLARALHAALCGQPKPALLSALAGGSEAAAAAQVPIRAAAPADAAPAASADTALAALAAAADVLARTQNFREAALAAANRGGNSDVLGAVCGALAGAHYGVRAIPAAWRNSLLQKPLIEGVADRLLARALLDLGA